MIRVILSALAGFSILVLLAIADMRCESNSRQVEVQEVTFVTPDTYFPSEVQVKHKNVGESPIKSIRWTVEYRSPVVDTTYWTRKIKCAYNGNALQPGDSWLSRCNYKGANPATDRTDRKPNASLFFTDVSVNTASD